MGRGITVLLACSLCAADLDYRAAVERWRLERAAQLSSDDGWLTVTGLFWLEPGENTLGAAQDSAIRLPRDAAPERAGVILLEGDRVTVRLHEGVKAVLNGQPVRSAPLRSDAAGTPDTLTLGRLKLLLLKRGDRFAIRLKDPESPMRKQFKGLKWYPIQEQWRIKARFLPPASPMKLLFDTIIGTKEEVESAGEVAFHLNGREHRLVATRSGKRLFIVFRDATCGKTTYGAGRFLYTEEPQGAFVVLDFNKAINPPCAYTPYATCPLPPKQNRLPVAIPAGEMTYEEHVTANP